MELVLSTLPRAASVLDKRSVTPRNTGACCGLQVRGPPAKQAFGADGKPTKALEGFCRKNGVDSASVTREADAKGVEYVYAVVRDAGRPAAEVRRLGWWAFQSESCRGGDGEWDGSLCGDE